MSALRVALLGLGGTAAFLDAVASRLGHGDNAVTGPIQEKADEAKAAFVQALESAAAIAAGAALDAALPGVDLDNDDPFGDSSLSRAVSDASGVPISSIADRDALKRDMAAGVTAKINEGAGTTFSNVFDREAVRQEIGRAAGEVVSQLVPGLELNDITDKAQTRRDMLAFAGVRAGELTGISFPNFEDSGAVKEAVYQWAMEDIRAREEAGEQAENYKPDLMTDDAHRRAREAQRRFRAAAGKNWEYEGVS